MPTEAIDCHNTLPLHKRILKILMKLLSFFHILYLKENVGKPSETDLIQDISWEKGQHKKTPSLTSPATAR